MSFGYENFGKKLSPEAEKVAKAAMEAFWKTFLEGINLENHPALQGAMEGLTPAQSMGLSRKELEVIYAVGFQKLNNGDFDAARDAFSYLGYIDPLHAPNYYCLGVAEQGHGDMEAAEKAYVAFCALDATNPVGYLRLAEIYKGKGETQQAIDLLEVAEAECLKGNGDEITLQETRAKLALFKGVNGK